MKDFDVYEKMILQMLYGASFFFLTIHTLMYVSEVIVILNATPDKIARYPFGSEADLSFNYCSKETYQAANLMFSYIGLSSLISSLAFNWFSHRYTALLCVAIPLALYFGT